MILPMLVILQLLSNFKIIIKWNLKHLLKIFAAQFDETDESVFGAETVFKELEEWSSLIALSVIAMIDEEYDVRIKGEDIRSAHTIQDLYNVVRTKE